MGNEYVHGKQLEMKSKELKELKTNSKSPLRKNDSRTGKQN
jgi:hypothetical protein